MLNSIRHHVRYWGFLLLKFAGAGLGSGFALWFLNLFWAPHTRLAELYQRIARKPVGGMDDPVGLAAVVNIVGKFQRRRFLPGESFFD